MNEGNGQVARVNMGGCVQSNASRCYQTRGGKGALYLEDTLCLTSHGGREAKGLPRGALTRGGFGFNQQREQIRSLRPPRAKHVLC